MIGIVDSGVAGLAAAYQPQSRSYDIRVFEAVDSLNDPAVTYKTNGDDIKELYHRLLKPEETIAELVAEFGPEGDLERRIDKDACYVDGVVHPLDTAWQIAAYPHISFYDRFHLGMFTSGIDVCGGTPDSDTYEELAEHEYTLIEEFVVEHTIRDVCDNLVNPLLDGKFGECKYDVSVSWFLGRVRFRGKRDLLRGEKLGYSGGGFASLIDTLVGAVGREHIETDVCMTGLDIDGEAVSALTVETDDGTETHEVESVVVTTMPNVLEDLTDFPCDIDF